MNEMSVTVTGLLYVVPLSLERTSRNAESGKRAPGTSLPTVYTAYSVPVGA